MRAAIGVVVGCAVTALVINTWIVEGLFVPLVVRGGSMAPALLGEHRTWHCHACGAAFACSLESLPEPGRAAVCPHCGAANDPAAGVDLPGDRLLVDRSAFAWREPRRWETVVVRAPDESDMLCVKRVVGLPGERIEIVDGDVLVDGRVARKDLATLGSMAVVVAGPADIERWQSDDGSWPFARGWFAHDAAADDQVHWLAYRHREHAVGEFGGAGKTARPIYDASPLDQNEARLLNEVDDVLLRCQVALAGSGELHVRAAHRGDRFEVVLDSGAESLELLRGGRTVRRLSVSDLAGLLADAVQLEFAVADCRVQFALGGRQLVRYDYEPDAAPGEPAAGLAVGARRGRIRVRNLEVLRDVYYLGGARRGATQYRLGEQEYFLLGDNSPRSLDSRGWAPGAGVPAELVLGRAITW